VPARDPLVGSVRVRADMSAYTQGRCLHCLSKDHRWELYLRVSDELALPDRGQQSREMHACAHEPVSACLPCTC
jgi:hypothetical protein